VSVPDNTRIVTFTAQQFIDHPELFEKVETTWKGKQWYTLFGEWPEDNRVMARMLKGGGIAFYYRPQPLPPK
jgi:hypothetical protein